MTNILLPRRPQEALLCAKAKRQQHCFICAKAKRQRQMFYLCESEATATTKRLAGTEINPHVMVMPLIKAEAFWNKNL
ncbi:hypothetical protein [Lysinibacillus sp. FJAT-14222]|uniref:hypothetical protein n=1 Tax=Lysinibacillus sp. FJAT-14222 TaxID=1932366 RepID=UPI001300D659|nr:hypothetical protein [Lysinibacillus sp. FJAT-14222]